MLAKAIQNVQDAELENIYHALIASYILYRSQVWRSKLISVSDKISRLQKAAIQIMTSTNQSFFKKLENFEILLTIAWLSIIIRKNFLEQTIYTNTLLDKPRLANSTHHGIKLQHLD